MTSSGRSAATRLGEGDREAAVRRVREAYAEERIAHEEMDVLLGRVLAARTRDDLAAALDPLPAEDPGTTVTIAAAAGRIRRRGAWRVPRFLKVESAFGRVRLDLSRAVFEHPVVDIELSVGTGGARITVPRDATVETEGLTTGWKDLRYRPPKSFRPGGPTVRLSGGDGIRTAENPPRVAVRRTG